MGSQLVTALAFHIVLGHKSGLDILGDLVINDSRAWAVFLGGFLLGHGDHIGSLAMQFIPAGIAYPLYSGQLPRCVSKRRVTT
jgi:hypothetical protein